MLAIPCDMACVSSSKPLFCGEIRVMQCRQRQEHKASSRRAFESRFSSAQSLSNAQEPALKTAPTVPAPSSTFSTAGPSRSSLRPPRAASGAGDGSTGSASTPAPARTQSDKVAALRALLASPEIVQAPACHDALSAALAQQAGFPMAFMSGFAVCATRAALPDAGLLSYGEMVEAGRMLAGAVGIPVIGDADTGYGSCMNVRRTVAGYRSVAGMAGAIIEDQEWPKACGHTKGRRVVSREEAVMRIRAAVDERQEGPGDIVIVARSDARQAVSVDEAVWRAQAFADAGADMVFVDALQSRDEMKALCKAVPETPKLANMLEGGGRTPILSPRELQDLGFSVVVYPLSLLGVCVRAMQDALAALKSGRLPPPGSLPSFPELQQVVGFPQYYKTEARYAIGNSASSPSSSGNSRSNGTGGGSSSSSSSGGSLQTESTQSRATSAEASPSTSAAAAATAAAEAAPTTPAAAASSPGPTPPKVEVVEAEYVLPPEGEGGGEAGGAPREGALRARRGQAGSGDAGEGRLTLRLKVTGRDGRVKLDVAVPGGFLTGLARTIPAVGGLDLEAILETAKRKSEGAEAKQMLVDIVDDGTGDRVQVSLE